MISLHLCTFIFTATNTDTGSKEGRGSCKKFCPSAWQARLLASGLANRILPKVIDIPPQVLPSYP
jgi:hypothetical protein